MLLKLINYTEASCNNARKVRCLRILFGIILECKGFYVEAIQNYQTVYSTFSSGDIATRIASCYGEIGLDEYREQWRKLIN
jgi:hypothetical protein